MTYTRLKWQETFVDTIEGVVVSLFEDGWLTWFKMNVNALDWLDKYLWYTLK